MLTQWFDSRLKFNNLKKQVDLNVLTPSQHSSIWTPNLVLLKWKSTFDPVPLIIGNYSWRDPLYSRFSITQSLERNQLCKMQQLEYYLMTTIPLRNLTWQAATMCICSRYVNNQWAMSSKLVNYIKIPLCIFQLQYNNFSLNPLSHFENKRKYK